ncbi:MAG: hypothetical protein PHF25_04295 [Candidatus Margulisbacteria bacterium]|nr:hypothetical protein [Candidatus Margulisiibacteriota bacterium]
MQLQSTGLDHYSSNYRFSSVKGEVKSLQESFLSAKGSSFANIQDFNNKLNRLELKGEKSSMLLKINEQPKDVMELLQKVAGGKYLTFLQNNVDGIMFGRNLEEKSSTGSYLESLGFSVSGASAKELSGGKMSKIIGIDTYNLSFQSVETETLADVVYTEQAQTVSVFLNELKQAYLISKGDSAENQDVFEFMQTVIEDVESYLDSGNSFNFVPSSEKAILQSVLSMMQDSITSHISDTYGDSSSVQWEWRA